ncbi:MAG: 30S ribosomal protein S6 [Armatimonadetes bacterium]|nr:30S ribosomal protein S6 [Armatimonadota bacterium]
MREYECLYIVHPQVADEQIDDLSARFQSVLNENGAELLSTNLWGRRRLAYEIDRVREGVYIQVRFNSEPEAVNELDRALKFSEHIIRHLIVRAEDLDPTATDTVPEELPERGPDDYDDRRSRGRRDSAPRPESTEAPPEGGEGAEQTETPSGEQAESTPDESPAPDSQAEVVETAEPAAEEQAASEPAPDESAGDSEPEAPATEEA